MSGNWDDSDTDSEPVEIVEKPVIIPRARQPSIVKSLEKVAILENSVAGSVKDGDDSDDDSLSVGSGASEDFEDFEGTIITLDFDATTHMKKMISQFTCTFRNIVAEFADVEIFLISLDSLIVECLAHKYHNWELAGQSIVLTTQIDRFLQQFVNLGGKFKLVVFTDFATHFARDTTAAFARATAIAHVAAGPFAKDLEYFSSPVDNKWTTFLHDLTPSFLMISTDNLTREACAQEDVNITPQLETIVLHALAEAVPIVPLTSIVVNFASVNAYHIVPKLVIKHNWDSFVAAHWDCNSDLLKTAKNPSIDVASVSSAAELWVNIIVEAKKSNVSEHFDSLACAALLSSLVAARRGASRVYLPAKEGGKRGLDVIRDRRTLLTTATAYLEKVNFEGAKFTLSDLWDGRMVLALFDYINANESVLPYRLQEEFAKLHTASGLSKPLAVDTAEKLFDPVAEAEDPLSKLPILYSLESPLLDAYIPEMKEAHSEVVIRDGVKQDYAAWFQEKMSWKLKIIEEEFAKKKEEKIEDAWQLKRANKARQFMSRWYEMFANSLEGRGSNLLVDFSRTPRFAKEEEEPADAKKKGGKAWAGQKQGGGGGGGKKAGKEPAKSKKDLILEANKKNKDQKIIESEKTKIKFATQQGTNATIFLENLYSSLEVPETRALCVFEITTREAKELLSRLTGAENMAARRVECVDLVGRLKECFVKHWNYLEEKQREQIVDLWVGLGFEAPAGSKPSTDAKQKKLDLGMNMVYYQLEYGGELIDIQSDPKKDERVTGFAPDAWQRRMLDSVDRGNSAIIVAPTSAGKTFVSYYCIEKVLRASDDDVVVYVSPSKALMNQVCGSVYARFKNKSMSRGRALFGTLTPEYGQNPLTCQVLVTVPESLETLLLSTNPVVQEFVSHIRYVVFDEVHSIGASEEAHIWEHLLLLIHCPFLALSATIGNAGKLHAWLDSSEGNKTSGKRRVDIIEYGERYSELELSIVSIDKPLAIEDLEEVEGESPKSVVAKREGEVLKPFMPYGVFMPEKLRMFGIPDDQQLTARQILQLYNTMASADKQTKDEFEPCHYFGYKPNERVWLSRSKLRELENKLKERFLQWLQGDEEKMRVVLDELGGGDVKQQLQHRALPFNKEKTAVDNIVPLIDEMRAKQMLPAICFNDDRHVCEALATRLGEELEEREKEFVNTAEFKNKYAIKDEEKLMKAAKRKRDLAEKKKKGDKPDENPQDVEDDTDPLASMRAKLKQVLDRFKLRGRGGGDQDTYDKMVERMSRQAKNRESSRLLLRLFERGIGFHHAGLNMVEKGAVEVLFRSGHLAIIFSTSTLALGVNMPCKTVMFGVDTPQLTPLLYRQMSGRAGRRGFDHSGTVVFMSVPTSKMRRLLTASLSNLQGNPPFTTSFLLRMLSYVHQKDVQSTEKAGPITTLQERTTVALSLVRNSFSLFTRKEAEGGVLQSQLKMFTAFSVQVLRHLQLLDQSCAGKNLYGLASSLQESEPGNLVFIHLLHKGTFHSLVKQYQHDRYKLKLKMLTVLANLFTRERLPLSFQPEDKSSYPHDASGKCQIFLGGLPSEMQSQLEQYNQLIMELYYKYISAASTDKQLIAPAFSVSGSASGASLLLHDDLVSPVFDGYSHDTSFLPIVNLDQRDHRGRKVHHNAFAVDFFIHESRQQLANVNRLNVARMWFLLHDFVEVLHRLSEGMNRVARPQDPVCELLTELYKEYDAKFRSAFGMRSHKD